MGDAAAVLLMAISCGSLRYCHEHRLERDDDDVKRSPLTNEMHFQAFQRAVLCLQMCNAFEAAYTILRGLEMKSLFEVLTCQQ